MSRFLPESVMSLSGMRIFRDNSFNRYTCLRVHCIDDYLLLYRGNKYVVLGPMEGNIRADCRYQLSI